jgi:hypothetical protein
MVLLDLLLDWRFWGSFFAIITTAVIYYRCNGL